LTEISRRWNTRELFGLGTVAAAITSLALFYWIGKAQDPIAENLAHNLPANDKPLLIQSVGAERDHEVADEYQQSLVDRGLQSKERNRIQVGYPTSDFPISVREKPDPVYVFIDPRAAG
jgi:hypothetical protein